MKFDFLDVENKTPEEQEKKKQDFIKQLQMAIKKRENKEKKSAKRKSKSS